MANLERINNNKLTYFVEVCSLIQINSGYHLLAICGIGDFTVVCSLPWPFNRSEAGSDLVLLQTFLLFMCKSQYSHANKSVNMIIYIV